MHLRGVNFFVSENVSKTAWETSRYSKKVDKNIRRKKISDIRWHPHFNGSNWNILHLGSVADLEIRVLIIYAARVYYKIIFSFFFFFAVFTKLDFNFLINFRKIQDKKSPQQRKLDCWRKRNFLWIKTNFLLFYIHRLNSGYDWLIDLRAKTKNTVSPLRKAPDQLMVGKIFSGFSFFASHLTAILLHIRLYFPEYILITWAHETMEIVFRNQFSKHLIVFLYSFFSSIFVFPMPNSSTLL